MKRADRDKGFLGVKEEEAKEEHKSIISALIKQILYILEFEQSTDRDEGFLGVKEEETEEEHKSIISALIKSALKWEFEHIF